MKISPKVRQYSVWISLWKARFGTLEKKRNFALKF